MLRSDSVTEDTPEDTDTSHEAENDGSNALAAVTTAVPGDTATTTPSDDTKAVRGSELDHDRPDTPSPDGSARRDASSGKEAPGSSESDEADSESEDTRATTTSNESESAGSNALLAVTTALPGESALSTAAVPDEPSAAPELETPGMAGSAETTDGAELDHSTAQVSSPSGSAATEAGATRLEPALIGEDGPEAEIESTRAERTRQEAETDGSSALAAVTTALPGASASTRPSETRTDEGSELDHSTADERVWLDGSSSAESLAEAPGSSVSEEAGSETDATGTSARTRQEAETPEEAVAVTSTGLGSPSAGRRSRRTRPSSAETMSGAELDHETDGSSQPAGRTAHSSATGSKDESVSDAGESETDSAATSTALTRHLAEAPEGALASSTASAGAPGAADTSMSHPDGPAESILTACEDDDHSKALAVASEGSESAETRALAPLLSESEEGESATLSTGMDASEATRNEAEAPEGAVAVTTASPSERAVRIALEPASSHETATAPGSLVDQDSDLSVADSGSAKADSPALRPTASLEGAPSTRTEVAGTDTSSTKEALRAPPR